MSSHSTKSAGERDRSPDTCTGVAGQVCGNSRAKSLGKGDFDIARGQSNAWMQTLRERARALLERRYGEKKPAFVRMVNVSRAWALRWLSPEFVDRNPAPLALLWAVDDDEFESLYVVIRADRRALREGK